MLAPSDLTPFLLERLQAEYEHRWVGPRLLSIAGGVRDLGGNYDDYERLVRTSNLWLTYTTETSNSVATQEKNLESAWDRSADHGSWELHDALTDLEARVRSFNRWPNARTAGRDRLVAVTFIEYCRDRNCFTRTLSQYELAKHAGISRKSTARALEALVSLGLLIPQDEHARTGRKTRRYRLHLRWEQQTAASVPPSEVLPDDPKSTCIRSLGHDGAHSDVWSRAGLGQTAGRVYEALTDEAVSVKDLAEKLGVDRRTASKHLNSLFDVGLAGFKPEGRSKLWFRGDAPIDAVAEVIGAAGHVARNAQKIELMQADQRRLRALPYAERTAEFGRRRDAALRRRYELSSDQPDSAPAPGRAYRRSFAESVDAMS